MEENKFSERLRLLSASLALLCAVFAVFILTQTTKQRHEEMITSMTRPYLVTKENNIVNTAIGYNALAATTTEPKNICLGVQQVHNSTESAVLIPAHAIAIGYFK